MYIDLKYNKNFMPLVWACSFRQADESNFFLHVNILHVHPSARNTGNCERNMSISVVCVYIKMDICIVCSICIFMTSKCTISYMSLLSMLFSTISQI